MRQIMNVARNMPDIILTRSLPEEKTKPIPKNMNIFI
jgi:hypothetical protein